jgi:opacity protein-like surface antigen
MRLHSFARHAAVTAGVILSLASAGWADADVDYKSASVGLRAANFNPKDGDDEWYAGLQMRGYLGKAFGLEGSIDYRQEELGPVDVDVFPVQASILAYLLPESYVNPYLIVGAGWYYTRIEAPGGFDDTDHRFGPHAGGGVQLMLMMNDYWSLDGSYRYVWLEEIDAQNENLIEEEYEDEGHMVTIGLNYHF